MSLQSYKADVVIVGGGIAGITTAIELLNNNQSVVVIDRDSEENLGGLAKESFGGMFFVDTPTQRRNGIKDSPELALKDWFSVANFADDDLLPKAWAKQYVYNCRDQVYYWLRSIGVKYFPVVHWAERGLFTPGNSYPRFHLVWGTGLELTRKVCDKLLSHPKASSHLKIYYNHKVEDLINGPDGVTGVIGIDESNEHPFEATGITVIATGGLGGNIDKVRKNWYKPLGEPPEIILNGAHKYAQGDLHDVVENHNGSVTHLDKNWPYPAGIHHPNPRVPNHGLSQVPPRSALWLDYTGKRFGPMPLVTGYDSHYCVERICAQKKKYSWQVMNMKIANKEITLSGAESNDALRNKDLFAFLKTTLFGNKKLVKEMVETCIDFITADTIEELVQKMNELTGDNDVSLESVRTAIDEYDAQIDRGPKFFNDEQLRRIAHARKYRGDRVRTSKFAKINDPNGGKLVAIQEFILSRKTLGGIQTDLDCKVVSKTGEPIPGLYSVGEAAGFGGGGVHGIGSLEGTFLGSCVLTGRIAAYDIAGKKLIPD